jgi:hypothetical protein
MKKSILLLLFAVLTLNCSDNDSKTEQHPLMVALEGKWQLTGNLYFDVEASDPFQFFHPVTNGYRYQFNLDGSFTSDEMANFTGGTYTIDSQNVITLTFINGNQPNQTKRKHISTINATGMDLDYSLPGLPPCFEGCGERFEKR